MFKYNGKEYEDSYDVCVDFDTHFTSDFIEAKQKYLEEYKISNDDIRKKALIKGVDIDRDKEEFFNIKKSLEMELENRASIQSRKLVAQTWKNPKPIPKMWYLVYTSWAWIRVIAYDEYRGWDIVKNGMVSEENQEKPLYWTPVNIVPTIGTEVNGIRYVNFHPWRFNDGKVTIFPLDKLGFRLKSNKTNTVLFAQSRPMTLTCAKEVYKIEDDEIIEIELIETDLNDAQKQIVDAENKRKEEERIKKENEEREKERERREEERKKREYEERLVELAKERKKNEEIRLKIYCKDHNLPEILAVEKMMLEEELKEQRASGRTTRIINQVVEDLFNKPIGTKIPIVDHFQPSYGKPDSYIVKTIRERLGGFKDYKIEKNPIDGCVYIQRFGMTNMEKIKKRLDEINEIFEN